MPTSHLGDSLAFRLNHATKAASQEQFLARALRMCVDAEPDRAQDLQVLEVKSHYKSQQAYLGVTGELHPRFVVKVAGGRWDAEREFRGLQHVEAVFASKPTSGGYAFGAIHPVGFEHHPPTLITRYQPGVSMRPVFDRALQFVGRKNSMVTASQYARAMAAWLHQFRQSDVRRREGFTIDTYQQACAEKLARIRIPKGRCRELERLASHVDRYLEDASDQLESALANAYPTHGDFCAQNFRLGPDKTVYVLDVGGFGYYGMNADIAMFRMRLEHYVLRGSVVRSRAQSLWKCFLDEYFTVSGEPLMHGCLSYLLKMLSTLGSWSQPGRPSDSLSKVKTRIKERLWIRNRLAWMQQLTGSRQQDVLYWYHHL